MIVVALKTRKDFRSVLFHAARVLRRGGIIIVPTDTVYGIGANIYDRKALQKLFLLKQRRESKPAPVFVRDLKTAKRLAVIPKQYEPMLKKHWPGFLTAVLKFKGTRLVPISSHGLKLAQRQGRLPYIRWVVRSGKIGLRVPDHPFLLALLKKVDFPITGTSANISGQPPCRSAKAFLRQLRHANSAPSAYGLRKHESAHTNTRRATNEEVWPDLVIDAGALPKRRPSTVVDFSGKNPHVLRPGSVRRLALFGNCLPG